METEIVKGETSLKQQLDAIDQEVIDDIANKCYEYHLKVEIGMWLKGKAIEEEICLRGGGIKQKIPYGTFWNLEKETGRNHSNLKYWYNLYIDVTDKEKYLEIAKQKAEAKTLNWLKKIEALTLKETGELNNNWLKVYDIWNFAGLDYNFGIEYPGNIPAGIVLNVLYYYTKETDLVVDPMAGGGVTLDCCKFLNRRCLAYDIQSIREDIKINDILKGYPNETKNCDLIFLDPPYFKKKEEEYGEISISALDKGSYLDVFNSIAKESFKTIKDGGYLAFLMEPYINYQDSSDSIWLYDYIKRFLAHNWLIERIYDVPQTSQRYQAFDITRAKENKIALTLRRGLIIFKKGK